MCLKEQLTKHTSDDALPSKSPAFRPALGVTAVLARVQALIQQQPTEAVLGSSVWTLNHVKAVPPKLHLVVCLPLLEYQLGYYLPYLFIHFLEKIVF